MHSFVEVQKKQRGSSSERSLKFCRLSRITMGFETFPPPEIEGMAVIWGISRIAVVRKAFFSGRESEIFQ
jgi:hypothetical protein